MKPGWKVTLLKGAKNKVESIINPDGHKITMIVRDSINFSQTRDQKLAGLVRMQLEVFVWEENITIKEVNKSNLKNLKNT